MVLHWAYIESNSSWTNLLADICIKDVKVYKYIVLCYSHIYLVVSLLISKTKTTPAWGRSQWRISPVGYGWSVSTMYYTKPHILLSHIYIYDGHDVWWYCFPHTSCLFCLLALERYIVRDSRRCAAQSWRTDKATLQNYDHIFE